MGLPRLAHSVNIAALKSGMCLLASGDVTIRALAELGDLELELYEVKLAGNIQRFGESQH